MLPMLREVKTKYGVVRGLPAADPRITSFKGIPFAAPPVGENRWRAPQPPKPWDGVLEAYKFRAISVQDRPGVGEGLYDKEWHVDPNVEMGEDNLYLNIWTPAHFGNEKLPVLVWYFGGGLQWGYPSEMEFDGERLARRGMIVVTVNYRLNVFGFMAHPEITAEAPDHPTNFGYLDQQAGTRWVYENIEAFGGDPEKITVAGQSAGGGSVMAQITNLENKDMIKRAIVMSGLIGNPYAEGNFPPTMELSTAEEWGKGFFELLGVSSLEEARKIDSATILAKYNEFTQTHPRLFSIIDKKFCMGDPLTLSMDGHILDIPIMAGNTGDEFPSFVPGATKEEYEMNAKKMYGENDGSKFLSFAEAAFDPNSKIQAKVNGIELADKILFENRKKFGSKHDFYYYRFNPDIPGDDNAGTFHSVDLWFFFETLAKCSRPFVGRHYDLARKMANYWFNFISCGDPNGVDCDGTPMPQWSPYTKENRYEMEFDSIGPVPKKECSVAYKTFLRNKMKDAMRKHTFNPCAVNPYLPSWEYVPDGEPYVFGDRLYIYGSHDFYNGDVFCMGDYVCWSAPINDLGNWRYEGTILSKLDDPLNPGGDGMLYAPDVTVGPDGRYYLFYVLSNVGNVSVAVSDRPEGPYTFYGHVHYSDGTLLGAKEGDEPQFDPGVLTEGDTTYLYTGFCGGGDKSRHGAMCTVLGPDMLTITEAPVFVVPGREYSAGSGFEGHEYFEAASIRKKGDKYFFVYSSSVMHELCYAVSDRPTGGFTYGGVLISNADLGIDSYKPANMLTAFGANNHGSIIEINGEWYVFYHRHTNGTWYSRQVCAEKLREKEDGGFYQAELTSCGLNNGPLAAKGYYPVSIACNMFYPERPETIREFNFPLLPDVKNVKIVQDGRDGEECEAYIANFGDGAVVGFKYFAVKNLKTVTVWIHGYSHGRLEVKTAWDKECVGSIEINSNNIWDRYDIPVNIPDGTWPIYLCYHGSGNALLKGICFDGE